MAQAVRRFSGGHSHGTKNWDMDHALEGRIKAGRGGWPAYVVGAPQPTDSERTQDRREGTFLAAEPPNKRQFWAQEVTRGYGSI
jgi:hypothetical protein